MVVTKLSRIDAVFKELRDNKRSALMPYLMAGYPDIEASLNLLISVAEAGADLIEFGIPYSDPLADGPTIQAASEVALATGINTDIAFELVKKAREKIETPVAIMTYYNAIYRYGLERFAKNASESGVDGVICPDLPPEEVHPWNEIAEQYGLSNIMFAAPTSTGQRLKKTAELSRGFIYCVSLTGVTGARTNLPSNLTDFIGRVRKVTNKPLAVGFGISQPEQAKQVAGIADGVIIGSALVSLIGADRETCTDAAAAYISKIRGAMDS